MTYTIFGESHGPAIGVVLQDVPSGIAVDEGLIARGVGPVGPQGKTPCPRPERRRTRLKFSPVYLREGPQARPWSC